MSDKEKRKAAVDRYVEQRTVWIFYRNHQGLAMWRTILPLRFYFGECSWHPAPQWLLQAFDADKQEERTFALKDILEWRVMK